MRWLGFPHVGMKTLLTTSGTFHNIIASYVSYYLFHIGGQNRLLSSIINEGRENKNTNLLIAGIIILTNSYFGEKE